MKEYAIKYARYAANLLLWAGVVWLVLHFSGMVITAFLPFLLGWVIATIANPLVRYLERRIKLKRRWGSMVIIGFVLSLMVLLAYLGIAKLASEATAFVDQIPRTSLRLSADWNTARESLTRLLNAVPPNLRDSLIETGSRIAVSLGSILQMAGSAIVASTGRFAKNLPSLLIAAVITIISSYFMLAERDEIKSLVTSKLSDSNKRLIGLYGAGISKVLGGYFKAQAKLLSIIAVILFIGLLVLKANYALLFAVLIALLDFLPFFGTGTALGPWAVFAYLSGDPRFAVGLVVIYLVTQLVRRVLEPKILGDTIGMDPLLTLILMYAGYKLLGVWGLIFAAPVGLLLMNLHAQGVFDNVLFILKDSWRDFSKLRDISSYRTDDPERRRSAQSSAESQEEEPKALQE